MSIPPRHRDSLGSLRCDLAGLTASLALLRAEHALRRKYRPDQPRAPSGGPDGGRWVADGGGSSDGASRTEEVVNADGSRVLTIRVRPNADVDWDEQHMVTSPEGERTLFETSGLTQTIRDGETGAILARSRLTREGAVPEAFVQEARVRLGPPGSDAARAAAAQVARTLEAAGGVFAAVSQQIIEGFTAIFAAPASEYKVGEGPQAFPLWVGKVSQRELDSACPRNREVQALADEMARRVRATSGFLSPQNFGNRVHSMIADEVNSRNEKDFVAEKSYVFDAEPDPKYGTPGSIRVDVLEKTPSSNVCVYDHKTRNSRLTPMRVLQIMEIVQRNFPGTQRFLMIEIRPRR